MITKLQFQQGLSFLELLTILAIAGILATLSIPLFTSLIQNYRISATGENLYYSLQYARTEAVKRNATVYVSFHAGDTWCYGINTGSACDCTTASNCNLGTTSYAASQQMSLSITGLSGTYVSFEKVHGAASASGDVTFTQYGQSSPLITVMINRLGNLQLCATGISGYTAC